MDDMDGMDGMDTPPAQRIRAPSVFAHPVHHPPV
jgi:hypothetical protein